VDFRIFKCYEKKPTYSVKMKNSKTIDLKCFVILCLLLGTLSRLSADAFTAATLAKLNSPSMPPATNSSPADSANYLAPIVSELEKN
jgi:hypothetical protein